ncbi:MAG: tetratricopeptide repeat protein [Ignavibacteriales bacterium]|nr:tetratricopeptide repeat protein [Ignavibacteriales bacterium]
MRRLVFLILTFITTNYLHSQQDGEDISLGKYRVLRSEILNEDRTLLIALPDEYENSNLSFPVLYLLYGDQVKGYFVEAVNIIDRLSGAGEIPPFIIVGVANKDRYRDCLPLQQNGTPGGAEKFLRFLKEELNPFIKSNYRTKHFNFLAGPQAGAAFGLYSLLEKSDLFGALIVTNPFWTEYTRSYFLERMEKYIRSDSIQKKFLFITYWDREGWQDHRGAVEALNNFSGLFNKQKSTDFVLHLNYIPDNKDFVPPIGLKEGLRKYFQNYNPSNYSELNTLSDIQKYYLALSKGYGFEVYIPEMILVRKSDDLQNSGNLNEVRNILNHILHTNPISLNALSRMASLHRTLGEYDNAINYFEMFLKVRKEPFFERQLQLLLKFKEESAVYILEPILNSSGIEAVLLKHRELKNDRQNKRKFDEREFNSWGYRLLQRSESEKAIEVFKLNAELHPESANVYDSLGEVYMKAGNKELAIKNYEKSLELDPNNENAKKTIDELRTKK